MSAHILAIRINAFMNNYCNRAGTGDESTWIDNIEKDIIHGNTHTLNQAIESGVRRNPAAATEANSLQLELVRFAH